MKIPHPTIIAQKAALLITDESVRTLVISDVHVGFESAMASRGVNLASLDTARTMANEITSICKEQKASRIILLGDIKDGTFKINNAEWKAIPEFLSILAKCASIVIVPGNHDAGISKLIPDNVTISVPFGIVLGDTLFTHGHVLPSQNLASISRIVMGHVHPTLRDDSTLLGGQRVWLSIHTNKDTIFPSSYGTLEVTVMPSFNRYIVSQSTSYRKKSISPILTRVKTGIISAKILTLDGVIIGNESLVNSVI